jgi:hypothetical protein
VQIDFSAMGFEGAEASTYSGLSGTPPSRTPLANTTFRRYTDPMGNSIETNIPLERKCSDGDRHRGATRIDDNIDLDGLESDDSGDTIID